MDGDDQIPSPLHHHIPTPVALLPLSHANHSLLTPLYLSHAMTHFAWME
jgi:hypothetical protein